LTRLIVSAIPPDMSAVVPDLDEVHLQSVFSNDRSSEITSTSIGTARGWLLMNSCERLELEGIPVDTA
jgi:hypothetical protein